MAGRSAGSRVIDRKLGAALATCGGNVIASVCGARDHRGRLSRGGFAMSDGQTNTFEVGLAMAGAISAGAYSGGVFDFLIQALDEWERAKTQNRPDIPNHQVVIKVISGASAGAITGAIGTVALAGGVQRQPFETPAGPQEFRCVLPNLYRAWVIQPRLVSMDGADLLSLEDVNENPAAKSKGGEIIVRSVLNSVLLDDIREQALKLERQGEPVPYVSKDLHVYLTVSNLRGVPYAIQFAGGGYGMQTHGDRLHYIVDGLGTWSSPSPWADKDAGERIAVKDLVDSGGPSDAWKSFGIAAIASGAFPVGLAAREIETRTDQYDTRYLPIEMRALVQRAPNWPEDWHKPKPRAFKFLCVDGGLINNEPFEYARYALMTNPPKPNERGGNDADRAVIMVDPFPEPPDFLGDEKPPADVVNVIAALFPALINQARFKPSELIDAVDPDVFSRFLIAPHRHYGGKSTEELYAIACGLLGGFGGFLDAEFRKHDYQLGRRNCQRFLKDAFALPAGNPIVQQWSPAARANPQFQTATAGVQGQRMFCIVPLFGSALEEVVLPPWPRMAQEDLTVLQRRLKARFEAVAPIIIERQTASRVLRLFLKAAAFMSKERILQYARYAILSDLVLRDQIAGWELPDNLGPHDPQEIRKVLAELAHPAYDFRTPAGIGKASGVPDDRVQQILAFLEGQTGKPYLVWRSAKADRTAIYTLDSRKPSRFWRLPVIKGIGSFLNAPAID